MKKLFILLIILLVIFCFSVIGIQAFETKGGVKILKLAHVNPVGSLTDIAATRWAELVEEGTDGKVKIEIFPSEQLGIEKAALEGVVLGTIDCSLNDAAYLASLYPPMGVCDFPYTFRDFDHYRKVLKSDDLKELGEMTKEAAGIKVLSFFLFGRRMVCSNKPFFSPEEAKGLSIRTPTSKLAMENARVVGAEPVTIAYSEAYMGLKQGLADGAENPLTGIYDMRWDEVTKYLILTEHVWNNEVLSMSLDAWNSLTPEQQKVVYDAAQVAAEYRLDLQIELADQRLKDLRKNGLHIIIPATLQPFIDIAAEIEKNYREEYSKDNWGEWHDRIINIK
jgi:tripartite ATP-independent transporter DctP family solute receptor